MSNPPSWLKSRLNLCGACLDSWLVLRWLNTVERSRSISRHHDQLHEFIRAALHGYLRACNPLNRWLVRWVVGHWQRGDTQTKSLLYENCCSTQPSPYWTHFWSHGGEGESAGSHGSRRRRRRRACMGLWKPSVRLLWVGFLFPRPRSTYHGSADRAPGEEDDDGGVEREQREDEEEEQEEG